MERGSSGGLVGALGLTSASGGGLGSTGSSGGLCFGLEQYKSSSGVDSLGPSDAGALMECLEGRAAVLEGCRNALVTACCKDRADRITEAWATARERDGTYERG